MRWEGGETREADSLVGTGEKGGSKKGWHMRRQPSLDGIVSARSFCLYARANVASWLASGGLSVHEKCQFSRGARRVLLRRTRSAGSPVPTPHKRAFNDPSFRAALRHRTDARGHVSGNNYRRLVCHQSWHLETTYFRVSKIFHFPRVKDSRGTFQGDIL